MFKKFKILSLLFSCFSIVGLTSCSAEVLNFENINVLKPYKTLSNYIVEKDSDVVNWISQRTISLRFSIKNLSSNSMKFKFGTGWILNKVNQDTNDFSYYIATNIHVANTLNPLNETTVRYEEKSNGKIGYSDLFEYSNFAINFIKPTSSPFLRDENNNLEILEDNTYINFNSSVKPEIVYTATGNNFLEGSEQPNNPNGFVNPTTNQLITNPALDLAILKIDFSSILNKNNFQNYSVKSFLDTYNQNPTVFYEGPFDYDETYYIASFVQDNTYIKENNRPTWIALNNIKFNALNNFQGAVYEDDLDPLLTENQHDLMGIRPINGIDYVQKESDGSYIYWYKNVASQLLMEGANIGGGSSGSLICNSKKQVIGIYWGLYNFVSDIGIETSYGAVDLFLSNGYKYYKQEQGIDLIYTFPKYNLLTNLVKNNLISQQSIVS